mgnify:CR=1 FL=1
MYRSIGIHNECIEVSGFITSAYQYRDSKRVYRSIGIHNECIEVSGFITSAYQYRDSKRVHVTNSVVLYVVLTLPLIMATRSWIKLILINPDMVLCSKPSDCRFQIKQS